MIPRNILDLKTINDKTIKETGNPFRLKKNEAIKEWEKGYYKPLKVGKIWNRRYIEYEGNGDRNKTLSKE